MFPYCVSRLSLIESYIETHSLDFQILTFLFNLINCKYLKGYQAGNGGAQMMCSW